jgi:putative ABC transport system permease protein
MDRFVSDLRYTLRLLRKSPFFTGVAICTLALGIGANAAIFALLDAILLRPLPYSDPDRVVMVWEDASFAGFPKNTPAPANFYDWRGLNHSFVDLAATQGTVANVTAPPEQWIGRSVTASFFPVLGVQPALGRTFTEDDARTSPAVLLISHGLWQRRFNGDPSIVGRTIRLNDEPYEILGVMPRDFVFRNRDVDYWRPIRPTPEFVNQRDSHFLNVVARLKPGVTFDMAQQDMSSVAAALAQQFPTSNSNVGAVVVPVAEDLLGNTRVEVLVLMAASVVMLLIACANLAGLLLSRAIDRRGEFAIRTALGASRARLLRQMIIEGLILSLAGGGAGLGLAQLTRSVLGQLVPATLLSSTLSATDMRVLVFTFMVSLGAGVAFSLVPALQASRTVVGDALQHSVRSTIGSGRRTRDALVILQVAAAVVLLVSAGLMLRTLANLRGVDLGFRSDHVLTMRTTLPQWKYGEPAKRLAFYERVLEDVRRLPGVQRAAFGSTLPFTSVGNTRGFRIDGRARESDEVWDALYRAGTGDYLATLGVRLVEGRLIDERDSTGAPLVVVINETMAKRYWPNRSPLGQRIAFGPVDAPWYTIVGVVQDVRERGYDVAMKDGVYVSGAQYHMYETRALDSLIVRVNGDAMMFAPQIQRIIASIDPDQPVAAIRTMDDIVDFNVADRQEHMTLLGAFAVLALVLVSLGLYGLLAQTVSSRSREIGLRMALGATPRSVTAMIVSRGLMVTGVGVVIGIGGAAAATRAMNSLLYGVVATDPRTFSEVIALLAVVALAACTLPALRAARLDPATALRE